MKMRMDLAQAPEQIQAQSALQLLEKKWTEKLERKFALAPHKLVSNGLVCERMYQWEKANLSFFSFVMMHRYFFLPLRLAIDKKNLFLEDLLILGAGLGGDALVAREGFQLPLQVTVIDVVQLALNNLEKMVRCLALPAGISYRKIEAEDALREYRGKFLLGVYASRFFQILEKEKLRNVLNMLGASMKKPDDKTPCPSICCVHPLPCYNTHAKWEDLFKDSQPYPGETLCKYASEGYGGEIVLEEFKDGTHTHYKGFEFYQNYTFFMLKPKVW